MLRKGKLIRFVLSFSGISVILPSLSMGRSMHFVLHTFLWVCAYCIHFKPIDIIILFNPINILPIIKLYSFCLLLHSGRTENVHVRFFIIRLKTNACPIGLAFISLNCNDKAGFFFPFFFAWHLFLISCAIRINYDKRYNSLK